MILNEALTMTHSDFELPEDFTPEFARDYALYDNFFTIAVEYKGMIAAAPSAMMHTWYFEVIVNDNRVKAGVFHWDPADYALNCESVANYLSTYWGHNKVVRDAQVVPKIEKLTDNETVAMCVLQMFKDPLFVEGATDYDIVTRHFSDHGYTVIIMPNHDPQRLYIFNNLGDSPVAMWTYMKTTTRIIEKLGQS